MRQRLTLFGCLNLKTRKFYWKRSQWGNSGTFISFLTQLRQCFVEKEIVVILDNYSIHKSKKVSQYVKRFPMIHLFYLPPYSPEYNPVDRIWGWIKPKEYGFSAVSGMDELMKRFRTTIYGIFWITMIEEILLNLLIVHIMVQNLSILYP